jgi:hypothetical protein
MWEPIVIDDRVPCSYGGPAFAKSADKNEMWVPLLEKAYAKFYGAYEELEGGWISDALGASGSAMWSLEWPLSARLCVCVLT